MNRSKTIALISVFAALNTVCDSIAGLPQLSSGVWYGWIFMIEPLNGIILGPVTGSFSTFIGVMIGHSIYLRGEASLFEYIFTLGAPLGAMISGLTYRRRWKPVFAYFALCLSAYFITPITWDLPIWGVWDVLLAFLICVICIVLSKLNNQQLWSKPYTLILSAFIGLEADILFRIFLLIPCQTYHIFYGFSVEVLQYIWSAAAFITPIQVAISLFLTTLIGRSVLKVE